MAKRSAAMFPCVHARTSFGHGTPIRRLTGAGPETSHGGSSPVSLSVEHSTERPPCHRSLRVRIPRQAEAANRTPGIGILPPIPKV